MIYMTTDEWKKISKIIEEKDFGKLATEISVSTYNLDISEQELDRTIKDKEEPKRLWRIYCDNPDINSIFADYVSEIKDLTESEAVKWYNEYTPSNGMKKVYLYYKKEGEWVVYETTN